MATYQYYKETSPNIYKRLDQKGQYIVIILILFALGAWFATKAPGTGRYIAAVAMFVFGCSFFIRMFNSIVIDLNSQTILQKSGLFSIEQKINITDIQSFSISNRIYLLLLISTAFAIVKSNTSKPNYILLGQNLMNAKNTEKLLLETEKILGRR